MEKVSNVKYLIITEKLKNYSSNSTRNAKGSPSSR